jgi:predicted ABC-type ATPase
LAPLVRGSVFVNADEIAKARWPEDAVRHSYEAARIAADTRKALIGSGRSFIAETVFSHPSKLELLNEAHTAGYVVALHVVLISEALAVQRVAYRVRAGGHHVPENKIRERYQRLWPLASDAITQCDSATVYDNSQRSGPRIVARFAAGQLIETPRWPSWTPEALTVGWPR